MNQETKSEQGRSDLNAVRQKQQSIWHNNQYEKLSELYGKYGNKVESISKDLKKEFQQINPKKYEEAFVQQKIISLIAAGLDVLKFEVEVREEDFYNSSRELTFMQSQTIAPYIYHSNNDYLQEKVKLIKLDYDDRLSKTEVLNLLKVATNSVNDGKQVLKKKHQYQNLETTTQKTNSNGKIQTNDRKNNERKKKESEQEKTTKGNLIQLIQLHGNDFQSIRNVIGVANLSYVRQIYSRIYKQSIRRMVSYIIFYFNSKFERIKADDCNLTIASLLNLDMKYDPNRIELRKYIFVLLRAMNRNLNVSRQFIYHMYCSFMWVKEQLKLKKKKKFVTYVKEEWTPQQLMYMLQNYRQNVSYREIGKRMLAKFGEDSTKFKHRRIEQALKRLILKGTLEMQTIMGERYHQFTDFFNNTPNQNLCYRFMRTPGIPLQLKHQLMLFNFDRSSSSQVIKKIVEALNKTAAEISDKINMQEKIRRKINGMNQSKKEKQLNGISDQVEIFENKAALNFRQYHRWTQQEQKGLFEIYRNLHGDINKPGNRFAEVSKQIKNKFKREDPEKYSVSKVQSKLSSIIRSGMQYLREAANRWYTGVLPEQFCMGKNYEKSAKILRSNDKNVRKLKIYLMLLHFEKNLQDNIQLRNQLVNDMMEFQAKWNKLMQQNSVKIQIDDANQKIENKYEKAEKIFDQANSHLVKQQDYEFVSNMLQNSRSLVKRQN